MVETRSIGGYGGKQKSQNKVKKIPSITRRNLVLDSERMDAWNFNGFVNAVRVFALPIKRRRIYRVVNFLSRPAHRRKSFLVTVQNCPVNWSRCSEDSCENFIIYWFYVCHFSQRASRYRDERVKIELSEVVCQVGYE